MHRKPADKLQIVQTHFQLLGSLSVVLVTEGGLLCVYIQNPLIGYCRLVGVSTEVFQFGLRVAERPFGKHRSSFLEQITYQLLIWIDPGF